jgi:hypothetical protein
MNVQSAQTTPTGVSNANIAFANSQYAKENQTLKFSSHPKKEPSIIDRAYQIPSATYNYLDGVFSKFYKSVRFNTDITDNTFENSQYYEMVAIPLVAENSLGLQFEVFGKFSNSSNEYLSNLPNEMIFYNYQPNEISFEESDLNLGVGFSFRTSPATKVKVILSDGELPGYGSSKAIIGFESIF